MIKAIIFDCFGVIITDAYEAIYAELMDDQPAKARDIDEIMTANNRGFLDSKEASRRVAEVLGVDVDEFRERTRQGEVRQEKVLDYILELRADYMLGLLSNVSAGGLQRRFSQEELLKYFNATVASGDIGYAKPEPEAYEIIAEKLGVRLDECVMIDDREVCVQGARAVGMQAILYKSFEQMKRELEPLLTKD